MEQGSRYSSATAASNACGEAVRGLEDPRRAGRARPHARPRRPPRHHQLEPRAPTREGGAAEERASGVPSLDRVAIGTLIANTPKRYRTLIAVSVLTSIRQGEALGLRWNDVDFKAGLLHIRYQLDRVGELVEPKTAAAKRDVPIPPSLARMLTAHKQQAFAKGHAKASDFVFASETGAPLDHRNITRRGLEKALERGKLPKLRWHDLRHIAAFALIGEGASVPYVSGVLGHANRAITLAIYAHEFGRAEHADRTRERIEHAFSAMLE
jgi:integrase